MTDELDILKRALRNAPPAPDAEARARAIALAMENFDRLQGTDPATRPSEDRPKAAGFLAGVRLMLTRILTRPAALAATTSALALGLGLGFVLPAWQDAQPEHPGLAAPPMAKTAPPVEAAPEVAPASSMAEAAPAADARVAATEGAATAEASTSEPAATEIARTEAEFATADAMASEAAPMPAPPVAARMPATISAAPPVTPAIIAELPPVTIEDTEAWANAEQNPVRITAEAPVSTFSIDVDTASWAAIRSTLNMGRMPLPQQVRIEEMVNYFPYSYAAPEAGEAFRSTIAVMPTPWNESTQLVTIGLQGELPAVADRPALNLVFLVDTSGSMAAPNKLGLLKQSLALMLPELRAEDQIAIVAYAGSAGEVLPPTPAHEQEKILAALDALEAGGSTAGGAGLELAYALAAHMTAEGEVSRVILATDGDFNVGVADPEGLEAFITRQRAAGSYLSVLGFGRGNLDDAAMQALAQNGNGMAAYIDTLSEARKVLVDQLSGALFPIADDVKIQVEWNPARVAEYRLIGYETRALAREDFNNDKVDAGEIGAGLQVTAIYEIATPGSAGLVNDPLRYATPVQPSDDTGELGFLRLRWKTPGEEASQLRETPITGQEPASTETRFAAAIAGFGQMLSGAKYLGSWGWEEMIALALENRGEDPFGYRIEAVTLMRLAGSLAKQPPSP